MEMQISLGEKLPGEHPLCPAGTSPVTTIFFEHEQKTEVAGLDPGTLRVLEDQCRHLRQLPAEGQVKLTLQPEGATLTVNLVVYRGHGTAALMAWLSTFTACLGHLTLRGDEARFISTLTLRSLLSPNTKGGGTEVGAFRIRLTPQTPEIEEEERARLIRQQQVEREQSERATEASRRSSRYEEQWP